MSLGHTALGVPSLSVQRYGHIRRGSRSQIREINESARGTATGTAVPEHAGQCATAQPDGAVAPLPDAGRTGTTEVERAVLAHQPGGFPGRARGWFRRGDAAAALRSPADAALSAGTPH